MPYLDCGLDLGVTNGFPVRERSRSSVKSSCCDRSGSVLTWNDAYVINSTEFVERSLE